MKEEKCNKCGRINGNHFACCDGDTNEIKWNYFFGSTNGNCFIRYYSAKINGIVCEKCGTNNSTRYSIGNFDEAKKKYKTENELIEAIKINNL